MPRRPKPQNPALSRPIYSYVEAGRIASLNPSSVKRWLRGYEYPGHDGAVRHQPAVATGQQLRTEAVSFIELIELAAIARLKEVGFSIPKIRLIVDRCGELFGTPHPLAELRFKVDGRDAFVEMNSSRVDLGLTQRKRRQAWDEVLEPFLETIEYEGDVAHRWWPDGMASGVVVDPDFGLGVPVVASTGVRTEILFEVFLAGESEAVIADDFDLSVTQVEAAIRFEARRAESPANA